MAVRLYESISDLCCAKENKGRRNVSANMNIFIPDKDIFFVKKSSVNNFQNTLFH
jgi:hypothetical protein